MSEFATAVNVTQSDYFSYFPVASVSDSKMLTEGESLTPNGGGSPCQNGPVSRYPESPVSFEPIGGLRGEEPAAGVPGFHDNLKPTQAPSAEGVVLRKEALQSLKLSLPMQETELCKHLFMVETLLFRSLKSFLAFLSGSLQFSSLNIA